ncbi:MAG: hypothetical protein VXW22_12005, partial [Pseudomonadota bacterium]|nr:hypothetical protein [Pseudomonadota bacterium]
QKAARPHSEAVEKSNRLWEKLRSEKTAIRWWGTIKLHVLDKIGNLPIEDIDQRVIHDTLDPIWRKKADTAKKALYRLGAVMKYAAALGHEVNLNAVLLAKELLGPQGHVVTSTPSMPWKDIPEFYSSLEEDAVGKIALKLLINLPGPRSKPIRFLHVGQIDGDVWTVPGRAMKGHKGKVSDWRVPLSPECLRLIEAAKPYSREGWLFPALRDTGVLTRLNMMEVIEAEQGVISDMTMAKVLKNRGLAARPHGYRSAFSNWTAETRQSLKIAELSNGRTFHTNVQNHYFKTDYLDERREMMNRWSEHVTGRANADVIRQDAVRT